MLLSATSVGIIGGADGPTAIFVAGLPHIAAFVGALIFCALLTVLLFRMFRK